MSLIIERGDLIEVLRDKSVLFSKKALLDELNKTRKLNKFNKVILLSNLLYSMSVDLRLLRNLVGFFINSSKKSVILQSSLFQGLIDFTNINKEIIENIDYNISRFHRVSRLIVILDFLGNFELALTLRLKHHNYIMNSIKQKGRILFLKFQSFFFYQNDFEKSFFLLQDIKRKNMVSYPVLYEWFILATSCVYSSKYNETRDDFYLEKKKVLVLSPGFTEQLDDKEILNYDVMVSYNDYRLNSYKELERIVFLNNTIVNSEDFLSKIMEIENIKLLILKRNRKVNIIKPYRVSKASLMPFNFGHMNLIQFSLFELLNQPINYLRILGLNFYLSKKTHDSGYGQINNEKNKLRDVISNDQFTSINLIRTFYYTRRIDLDDSAKMLIMLDDTTLSKIMKELYVWE